MRTTDNLCFLGFKIGTVIGLIIVATVKICGCDRQKEEPTEPTTEQTVTHDTLTKCVPILVYDTIREYVTVRVPVKEYIPLNPKIEDDHLRDTAKTISDSVDVLLPITQREYSDSDYTAWVSGYNPSLDSIRLYRTTITNTKVVTPRLGLSVGVGASFGTRIEPCVFLGLTYTIKTF